jgi:beta-glucuronidase
MGRVTLQASSQEIAFKTRNGYNRKGLVSEDGKKKQSFGLVQEFYKEHSVGKPD